jgi:putative DNA primase/helicase
MEPEDGEDKERARFRRAQAILYRAQKDNDDDAKREANTAKLARYFNGRGIEPPPGALLLSARSARELDLARAFPAVVLPITDVESKIRGVHVTFLNRDCTAKLATVDRQKQTFGLVKGGFIVLRAPQPDAPLVVGEGIESALSAAKMAGDLPAIAAISAANMPALPAVPACSEVIVAGDRDESKAGQKAARALAQKLANQDENRTVRIALPPQIGADWNDVLQDGEDLDEMRNRILRGKIVEAEEDILPVTLDDFLEQSFPRRPKILAPWLVRGSVNMLHAQRGHGKTNLALSIANAVACGNDLLGWQCEHPGRVLYIDGELPGHLLQARVSRLSPKPPEGSLIVLAADHFYQRKKTPPDIGTDEGRAYLDRVVKQFKPDLIIFDSISTLVRSGGLENEAESWRPVEAWLMRLRSEGRAVILLHHEGKGGSPRGSSKREDVLDTIIKIKELKDDDLDDDDAARNKTRFEISYPKHRDFFGKEAEPVIATLDTASGATVWTHEPYRSNQMALVDALLKANTKQKDIAAQLKLSPARVSQIVKKIHEKRLKANQERDAKARDRDDDDDV